MGDKTTHIGMTLRSKRLSAGFKSVDKLAATAGVSNATFLRIERGERGYRNDELANIARSLQVSPDVLLNGDDDARPSSTKESVLEVAGSDPNLRIAQRDASEPRTRPSTDIDEFIGGLDYGDIAGFSIMSITGQSTVRIFLNAIERIMPLLSEGVHCRILLKSPFTADKRRGDAIRNTNAVLNAFKRRHAKFNFEVRTYAAAFPLYATICEHRDGRFSAVVSSYLWRNLNHRETASGFSETVRNCKRNHPQLSHYISWFDHFWGQHKIQTVLLDFDDTLYLTTAPQVGGWISALKFGLDGKLFRYSDLNDDIAKELRSGKNLEKVMTDVFLDNQDQDKIAKALFKVLPSEDILEVLRNRRTKIRDDLTLTSATPIYAVLNDLRKLRDDYQLVIVSATSETLIYKMLEGKDIDISFIFGREAQKSKWSMVEHKSQHFIGISSTLGIPLERMVFVGDSNSDFRAAEQLGIHFIENVHNAKLHGRPSLISSDKKRRQISGDNEGELTQMIKNLEAAVRLI